jgi:biopolymer transport protein ExbD
MIKSRVKEASEVDITPMIDVVFQLIIFFMVVMSTAVVYGVAIKFPPPGKGDSPRKEKEEKRLTVYVQQDYITEGHVVIQDGVLKLNGEDIALTRSSIKNYLNWGKEREQGYDDLQIRMQKLIDKGYKTDVLFIQGDMKSYHGKIMRVIDRGKRVKVPGTEADPKTGESRQKYGIDGFSLVPPQ